MGILDGKVAIVTGGGRGIGRGHCLEFARQGARVVVNDLGGALSGEGCGSAAEETVALICERGGKAVANFADVADYAAAEALIALAHETFGRFDILVNNAGILRDAVIWKMTEADFDAVMRVHVKGAWTMSHHASRFWREESKGQFLRGRRIINTTSGSGLYGNFGQSNYSAAKAAIVGLTLTLAVELQKLGATVNCISPLGLTRITASIAGFPPAFETNELAEDEYHPMDPGGSSPAAAWLASDEAQFLSGQVLHSVGDRLTWMKGWSAGPAIASGEKKWRSEELGAKLCAQVFGVRAGGLRQNV